MRGRMRDQTQGRERKMLDEKDWSESDSDIV